jgi:hypothetical protein
VTRLSVSNSLSGGHWELDQVPAEGRGQQRAQDPSAVVEAQDDATRDAIDLRFRWGLDEHSSPDRSRCAYEKVDPPALARADR